MTKKTEVSILSLNELYRLYREGKNDEANVCDKRIKESVAEINALREKLRTLREKDV